MFDLVNIFDIFLPQLLLYPNPKDPLNGEAAQLLNSDEQKYHNKVSFAYNRIVKVREYVRKFASEEYVK